MVVITDKISNLSFLRSGLDDEDDVIFATLSSSGQLQQLYFNTGEVMIGLYTNTS